MTDAFVTGLITAIVAILGFYLTYRTSTGAAERAARLQVAAKKADFRRDWIENLRLSVSECDAKISLLVHHNTKMISQQDYSDWVRLIEYVEMMLNHEEPEHLELVKSLNEMFDIATDASLSPGALNIARKKASSAARVIFRKEWVRLNTELDDGIKGA